MNGRQTGIMKQEHESKLHNLNWAKHHKKQKKTAQNSSINFQLKFSVSLCLYVSLFLLVSIVGRSISLCNSIAWPKSLFTQISDLIFGLTDGCALCKTADYKKAKNKKMSLQIISESMEKMC